MTSSWPISSWVSSTLKQTCYACSATLTVEIVQNHYDTRYNQYSRGGMEHNRCLVDALCIDTGLWDDMWHWGHVLLLILFVIAGFWHRPVRRHVALRLRIVVDSICHRGILHRAVGGSKYWLFRYLPCKSHTHTLRTWRMHWSRWTGWNGLLVWPRWHHWSALHEFPVSGRLNIQVVRGLSMCLILIPYSSSCWLKYREYIGNHAVKQLVVAHIFSSTF